MRKSRQTAVNSLCKVFASTSTLKAHPLHINVVVENSGRYCDELDSLHVFYRLIVQANLSVWRIEKRPSDFIDLYVRLRKEYGEDAVPSDAGLILPSAKSGPVGCASYQPPSAEALGIWLEQVIAEPALLRSPLLLSFLGVSCRNTRLLQQPALSQEGGAIAPDSLLSFSSTQSMSFNNDDRDDLDDGKNENEGESGDNATSAGVAAGAVISMHNPTADSSQLLAPAPFPLPIPVPVRPSVEISVSPLSDDVAISTHLIDLVSPSVASVASAPPSVWQAPPPSSSVAAVPALAADVCSCSCHEPSVGGSSGSSSSATDMVDTGNSMASGGRVNGDDVDEATDANDDTTGVAPDKQPLSKLERCASFLEEGGGADLIEEVRAAFDEADDADLRVEYAVGGSFLSEADVVADLIGMDERSCGEKPAEHAEEHQQQQEQQHEEQQQQQRHEEKQEMYQKVDTDEDPTSTSMLTLSSSAALAASSSSSSSSSASSSSSSSSSSSDMVLATPLPLERSRSLFSPDMSPLLDHAPSAAIRYASILGAIGEQYTSAIDADSSLNTTVAGAVVADADADAHGVVDGGDLLDDDARDMDMSSPSPTSPVSSPLSPPLFRSKEAILPHVLPTSASNTSFGSPSVGDKRKSLDNDNNNNNISNSVCGSVGDRSCDTSMVQTNDQDHNVTSSSSFRALPDPAAAVSSTISVSSSHAFIAVYSPSDEDSSAVREQGMNIHTSSATSSATQLPDPSSYHAQSVANSKRQEGPDGHPVRHHHDCYGHDRAPEPLQRRPGDVVISNNNDGDGGDGGGGHGYDREVVELVHLFEATPFVVKPSPASSPSAAAAAATAVSAASSSSNASLTTDVVSSSCANCQCQSTSPAAAPRNTRQQLPPTSTATTIPSATTTAITLTTTSGTDTSTGKSSVVIRSEESGDTFTAGNMGLTTAQTRTPATGKTLFADASAADKSRSGASIVTQASSSSSSSLPSLRPQQLHQPAPSHIAPIAAPAPLPAALAAPNDMHSLSPVAPLHGNIPFTQNSRQGGSASASPVPDGASAVATAEKLHRQSVSALSGLMHDAPAGLPPPPHTHPHPIVHARTSSASGFSTSPASAQSANHNPVSVHYPLPPPPSSSPFSSASSSSLPSGRVLPPTYPSPRLTSAFFSSSSSSSSAVNPPAAPINPAGLSFSMSPRAYTGSQPPVVYASPRLTAMSSGAAGAGAGAHILPLSSSLPASAVMVLPATSRSPPAAGTIIPSSRVSASPPAPTSLSSSAGAVSHHHAKSASSFASKAPPVPLGNRTNVGRAGDLPTTSMTPPPTFPSATTTTTTTTTTATSSTSSSGSSSSASVLLAATSLALITSFSPSHAPRQDSQYASGLPPPSRPASGASRSQQASIAAASNHSASLGGAAGTTSGGGAGVHPLFARLHHQQPVTVPSLKDFKLLKVIGKGSFGKVILVRHIETNVYYAMKVLLLSSIFQRKQVAHTRAERSVLAQLTHPFAAQLRFAFKTRTRLYFVLDYCPGGELYFHLQKQGGFNEATVRFCLAQLVCILEHLHNLNVIYRDLKPENILFREDGYIALTDFGLAKPGVCGSRDAKTVCGTPEYLAPEIVAREGYGKAADWWALGALAYEMCVGVPLFVSKDEAGLYKKILTAPIKPPRGVSKNAQDFIMKLLVRNPDERMGSQRDAAELKEHPFLADMNWDALLRRELPAPFVPHVSDFADLANFDKEFTNMSIGDAVDSASVSVINTPALPAASPAFFPSTPLLFASSLSSSTSTSTSTSTSSSSRGPVTDQLVAASTFAQSAHSYYGGTHAPPHQSSAHSVTTFAPTSSTLSTALAPASHNSPLMAPASSTTTMSPSMASSTYASTWSSSGGGNDVKVASSRAGPAPHSHAATNTSSGGSDGGHGVGSHGVGGRHGDIHDFSLSNTSGSDANVASHHGPTYTTSVSSSTSSSSSSSSSSTTGNTIGLRQVTHHAHSRLGLPPPVLSHHLNNNNHHHHHPQQQHQQQQQQPQALQSQSQSLMMMQQRPGAFVRSPPGPGVTTSPAPTSGHASLDSPMLRGSAFSSTDNSPVLTPARPGEQQAMYNAFPSFTFDSRTAKPNMQALPGSSSSSSTSSSSSSTPPSSSSRTNVSSGSNDGGMK